jgi:hypothetical protein
MGIRGPGSGKNRRSLDIENTTDAMYLIGNYRPIPVIPGILVDFRVAAIVAVPVL